SQRARAAITRVDERRTARAGARATEPLEGENQSDRGGGRRHRGGDPDGDAPRPPPAHPQRPPAVARASPPARTGSAGSIRESGRVAASHATTRRHGETVVLSVVELP